MTCSFQDKLVLDSMGGPDVLEAYHERLCYIHKLQIIGEVPVLSFTKGDRHALCF